MKLLANALGVVGFMTVFLGWMPAGFAISERGMIWWIAIPLVWPIGAIVFFCFTQYIREKTGAG